MAGGGAERTDRVTAVATGAAPPPVPQAVEPDRTAAQGGTPFLALDGFDGPLERLLALARAHQIDFARISLTALLAQLEAALRQAPATTSLGEKADWVVMAAWLLQLRSRLLLPADAPVRQGAAGEADQLRDSLVELQTMQALAAWLERRPQLGQAVFARGQPEVLGASIEPTPELDVIEFLWASMALFDDGDIPDTATVYRPGFPDLFRVPAAIARLRARLAERRGAEPLVAFLPALPPDSKNRPLLARSAVSSTFVAALELTREGALALEQAAAFQTVTLTPIEPAGPPPN